MAMKIDINKAYDRVDLTYLEHIIYKLGFFFQKMGRTNDDVHTISEVLDQG